MSVHRADFGLTRSRGDRRLDVGQQWWNVVDDRRRDGFNVRLYDGPVARAGPRLRGR